MPMGFGSIASRAIAGEIAVGGAKPAPLTINWDRSTLTVRWSPAEDVTVKWVNDTTLAINHEPGVDG